MNRRPAISRRKSSGSPTDSLLELAAGSFQDDAGRPSPTIRDVSIQSVGRVQFPGADLEDSYLSHRFNIRH